jgi:hypothetical protein
VSKHNNHRSATPPNRNRMSKTQTIPSANNRRASTEQSCRHTPGSQQNDRNPQTVPRRFFAAAVGRIGERNTEQSLIDHRHHCESNRNGLDRRSNRPLANWNVTDL